MTVSVTMHLPAEHVPPGHVMPQPPQLFGSVCSLAQVPAHPLSPAGQHTPPEDVSPLGQAQAPFWQLWPVTVHCVPQPPQLLSSVCSFTQAPLHTVPPAGQTHAPSQVWPVAVHFVAQPPQLFGSVSSFTQALPHRLSPTRGQAQLPLWQVCAAGHTVPQPPQLFGSFCSPTQAPPHAVSPPGHPQVPAWQIPPVGHVIPHAPQLPTLVVVSTQVAPPHVVLHVQLPFTQTSPGVIASHAASTAGSLSTIPSQSLSLPSQTSGEDVHWHTSPDWPISAWHVQPATQLVTVVQVVVQTSPLPTGWQMPLGQSEFLLHGVPVPFAGAFPHEPLRQLSVPAHVELAQHGSLRAPQEPPSPELASPRVVPSRPASCDASTAPSDPLELPPASATPTHTAPSHANPAAQLCPVQHATPATPQRPLPASAPPLPPLLLEQLMTGRTPASSNDHHDLRPIIENLTAC